MKPITKIKAFGAEKLNNLEYAYFATEFAALLVETTAENLHVEQNLVDTYGSNTDLLKDMTKQSRVSDETAQIANIDKQTDDLVVYIFEALRSSMKSPIATRRTAATELYNALKPYEGSQNLPQRQEVQAVEGMLVDLQKENLATHAATLGMNDVVEALTENASQYRATLEGRSVKQQKSLGSAKEIRKLLDGLYDYITTVAFAYSVVEPTEELDNFIKTTNRLINDARKAYNLRMGHTKPVDDEKDPVVEDPTQKPQETPAITAVYQKEGGDPENPHRIGRDEQTMVEYQGFTLKGQNGTLEHVIGLVNDQDYIEWINPETITNVTETSCEFTMVPDLTEGQYKVRIETYDGGSPLVVEYPEPITLW